MAASRGQKLFVVGGGILLLVLLFNRDSPPPSDTPDPATVAYEATRAYRDSVTVDVAWEIGGFDNVFLADVTVHNLGSKSVKDVAISCDLAAKSGTAVGSVKGRILEVFDGKRKRTVRRLNLGLIHTQADRATCGLADWSFAP